MEGPLYGPSKTIVIEKKNKEERVCIFDAVPALTTLNSTGVCTDSAAMS